MTPAQVEEFLTFRRVVVHAQSARRVVGDGQEVLRASQRTLEVVHTTRLAVQRGQIRRDPGGTVGEVGHAPRVAGGHGPVPTRIAAVGGGQQSAAQGGGQLEVLRTVEVAGGAQEEKTHSGVPRDHVGDRSQTRRGCVPLGAGSERLEHGQGPRAVALVPAGTPGLEQGEAHAGRTGVEAGSTAHQGRRGPTQEGVGSLARALQPQFFQGGGEEFQVQEHHPGRAGVERPVRISGMGRIRGPGPSASHLDSYGVEPAGGLLGGLEVGAMRGIPGLAGIRGTGDEQQEGQAALHDPPILRPGAAPLL